MEAKAIIGDARPRIDQLENTKLGIYSYDQDNAYPQRMQVIASASGTTKRCINTYMRFLVGKGFADLDFWKQKISRRGLRVDGLLRKCIKDYALLRGMAIHINYNILNERVEWRYIPYSFCRLGNEDHPGKIAVYNDWGRTKKRKIEPEDIDYIDGYNPDPAVIEKQIKQAGGAGKWKGQILWMSDDEMDYPLSSIDPVIEDVQSDAETKYFRYRSLHTNFMPSHVLVTDKSESETAKHSFANNLKTFQGSKNSLKILWVEKMSPNQTVDLKRFDMLDTDKMFEVTNRTIKDSIIENFGIPSILLNVRVAGELGNDSKKLKDATDFYSGLTADDRRVVSEFFQLAFQGSGVNPSENYDIIPHSIPVTADNIPTEFLPDLSKNERRALLDYPEETGTQSDTVLLATTLGVGGTQALKEILIDPVLKPEQKRETLKLLFGLTQEQVNLLVPITPAV